MLAITSPLNGETDARSHHVRCERVKFRLAGQSEVYLRSQLEDSRIEGRSDLAEVGRTETVADLVELRVVPRVEAFRAEFEAAAASFVEHKALEQREVPVVAAGSAQGIVSCVAEGANRGVHECRCIEPLTDLVGIRNGGDLIWTVGGIR